MESPSQQINFFSWFTSNESFFLGSKSILYNKRAICKLTEGQNDQKAHSPSPQLAPPLSGHQGTWSGAGLASKPPMALCPSQPRQWPLTQAEPPPPTMVPIIQASWTPPLHEFVHQASSTIETYRKISGASWRNSFSRSFFKIRFYIYIFLPWLNSLTKRLI